MVIRNRISHCLLVALLTLLFGSDAQAQFPSLGGFFSDKEEVVRSNEKPGTADWWSKYEKQAVFVPGQGYQVEGFEGYYDKKGRPIDAPVDEIGVKLTNDIDSGGGLIPGLDPKSTANRMKEAITGGPNQSVAEQYLQEGIERFNDGRYGSAISNFESAADRWPGSGLEAKAMFNKAEALFFDERYQEAGDAYIALLEKHPGTTRLNDSIERLFSIAQYWEKAYFEGNAGSMMGINFTDSTRPRLDTIGHSIRFYEAIRLNDPTGPRADDSIMATAGIHFRRENYIDADYHYGLLRKEYPRSEMQFEAHLLGLQTKLRLYRGADYDGTPLDEAKKLENRLRVAFSGRLSEEEKQRLAETRAQLLAMVEERDLRMVEYYEGTEHFGAAAIYLSKIINEYPDSPNAERARARLAEIQDKQAEPSTRLAWFVEMFPEDKKTLALNSVQEITPDNLNPDNGQIRVAEEGEDNNTETTTR